MGSVLNCRKEIADRYPIRWFKCKLKPPKNLRASTRTHDPFSENPKIWPTFIYRGEVPAHTFAKLPVCALINDLQKIVPKKVYVTIPQWFETFPNMSDLRSGRNRAKCGLLLNDPIDWFKLRLNQPKSRTFHTFDTVLKNTIQGKLTQFLMQNMKKTDIRRKLRG